MSFFANLSPFWQGILEPSLILYAAVKAYVELLCQDLWTHHKLPQDLRNRAFGKFWSAFSGSPPDPSVPLVGSAALVPPLLAQARGLVLDIGPGSGNLVPYFDAADGQIRHIYGVEPVFDLHTSIWKNIAGKAVGEKYQILHTDANKESIVKALVREGALSSSQDDPAIFDTIVCVRVLCSVPNLETTISDLYALLKPGGTLLVCEHTVNKYNSPNGSIIARIAQSIYMLLGWAHFVGNCSLVRDTEYALTDRGKSTWDGVNLKRNFHESVFTYLSGSLRKRDV